MQPKFSTTRIEAESPIKEFISTNELIKTNINISIKRISFKDMEYCINFDEDDEDDNISIED